MRKESKITNKQYKLLSTKKLVIFVITLTLVFTALFSQSTPVHAGFFDFLSDIFGLNRNNTENQDFTTNSQNVALLEAVLNPDIDAGRGGGDITIVNSSAIVAPNTGPLGTLAEIEELEVNQGQISLYVVREGDSLSEIAKMFMVSANTIIWTNDIKRGDLIQVGQSLVILPVSGIQYTIKKDDTLASIAKKYSGDVDEIVNYNGLENEQLAIGESILVPNGEYPMPKISTAYSSTRVRGTSGPSYVGYYTRPITGGTKTQGLHGYNAVDLAAPKGTPIVAAASGDVTISRSYGWNAGYGNYIVISHPNGTQTLYSHLNSNIVYSGWHVVKGQVIGYVGSTGKSTGDHVHFEVRGAKNPF